MTEVRRGWFNTTTYKNIRFRKSMGYNVKQIEDVKLEGRRREVECCSSRGRDDRRNSESSFGTSRPLYDNHWIRLIGVTGAGIGEAEGALYCMLHLVKV